MKTSMKIDFVSDIACPWCVIGLKSLEQALARLSDEVSVELHFQPFELNPQMPIEGQDITEHLKRTAEILFERRQRNRSHIAANSAFNS